MKARVLDQLPNALYRVRLENQHEALAHAAGGGSRNFVRLVPGDVVEVELSPADPTRGRIKNRVSGADERVHESTGVGEKDV